MEFLVEDSERAFLESGPDGSGWVTNIIQIFTGEHSLRWRRFADVAWLDQVKFTPVPFRPVIILSPTSQVVPEGQDVSFTVEALGLPLPTYAWLFNNQPIPNATNATLALTSVTRSNSGGFAVIASNSLGTARSSSATLTVFAVPDPAAIGVAVNATNLSWSIGGNSGIGWFVQSNFTYDGVSAIQSGPITDAQGSWVETLVAGPGTLNFRWNIDSDSNRDVLTLYTNSVTTFLRISGPVGTWRNQALNLPVGNHTLRWNYSKDSFFSRGTDAAWLDAVSFTPSQ